MNTEILKQMYVYENKTCEEIGNYFGTHRKAISKIVKFNNFKRCYQDEKWLIEQYINNSMQIKQIAKISNCSITAVENALIKSNIYKEKYRNRRSHKVNQSYFKIIDTEEKAYWLGFILADGCLYKRKDRVDNYTLRILLKKSDENHLKKFLHELNVDDIPIKNVKALTFGKEHKLCSIKISCSSLCKDLIVHGIECRKTLNEKPPVGVPEHLIRHFIRGYFDGDGSVGVYSDKRWNKYKYISVTFIGTVELLEWIQKYTTVNIKICNQNKIYRFQATGNIAKQVLDYMYADCTMFLDRKYKIYNSICKR